MSEEKTFKIVNGDISDGYHTFGELYDHRCLLFIALCLHALGMAPYWVEEHCPGWDLLVANLLLKNGERTQISYHVPSKYRHLYQSSIARCLPEDHKFDGHTSEDVLKRLEVLCDV